MKKFLLFSLLAAATAFGASADTYTLVFANSAVNTGETHDLDPSFVVEGFKFDVAKNSGGNAPAYNKNGSDVRLYAKNTMTISCQDANITSMTFTLSSQGIKRLPPITADPGTIATQAIGDETVVWTGSAASTTFTVGNQADYGSEGSSKAGQFDFTEVTIVTDGPITPFDGDIPTPPTPDVYEVSSVAQLLAVPNNQSFHFEGEMIVSYANGPDCYVFDSTGAALLYSNKNDPWAETLAQGTIIAEVSGKRSDYGSTVEFIPEMASLVVDGETTVTPKVINTAAEFTMDDFNYEVELIAVTFTSINDRNAEVAFSDGTSVALYNKFATSSYEMISFPEETEGKTFNIYGLGSAYNGNLQVNLIKADDVTAVKAIYSDAQVMVIGNSILAPAGARIYALNGTRVDGNNLPAGIYVVRVADKAVKVLVK